MKTDTTPITARLLRDRAPPPVDPVLGKESRGTVLAVGGSREVPGAVELAALGALRVGAGRVQVATVRSVAVPLAIATPELRVIGLRETKNGELAKGAERALAEETRRCQTLLLGCGTLHGDALKKLLEAHLGSRRAGAVVLDAGAIELAAQATFTRATRADTARVVVTPHAGEMASLLGIDKDAVLADPARIARVAARDLGVVVALKGADTFVATPEGDCFSNAAGNAGLGTAGSGDVLAGALAGLCARGMSPLHATLWAVRLHALAGERVAAAQGPLGYLARDVVAALPAVLGELDPHPSERPSARPKKGAS